MNINQKIFKGCIRYPILFFILKMIIQYFYDREVRWFENTAISVMMALGIMFVNWANIPYKWRKSDKFDIHT